MKGGIKNVKRVGLFTAIFFLVVVAFYMEPVFFPPKTEIKNDRTQQIEENQMTTWKYQELQATGFSTYIDQPVSKLEADFGSAYDRLASGFGFEIRYYQDAEKQLLLEANIQENKVKAVKVLNSANDQIAPFSFGMTMQDLTAFTTIYTNFTFDYQKEEIGIELMEEDMNYRPLIAFDNDTFAIMFFDQTTNGLFAVTYLDKESLLKLLPYQVFGDNLPTYQLDKEADWDEINRVKEQKGTELLNQLREEDSLPAYRQMLLFEEKTKHVLSSFLTKPEDHLTPERVGEWQAAVTSSKTMKRFSLTGDELTDILEKNQLKQTTGLFTHPMIDPTFSFLQWYSDPYTHERFMSESADTLAIAFSKENVLVLLQEEQEESSDSSDH